MEQRWIRKLVEVYTVRGDVDGKALLALGRSTRFGCDDFYDDPEDGYTGGVPEGGGFRYASGEMTIETLTISGTGPRLLVRVSAIDFAVEIQDPAVPYDRILGELETCVCEERMTEVEQWDEAEPLSLESILEPLVLEVHTRRVEPGVWPLGDDTQGLKKP